MYSSSFTTWWFLNSDGPILFYGSCAQIVWTARNITSHEGVKINHEQKFVYDTRVTQTNMSIFTKNKHIESIQPIMWLFVASCLLIMPLLSGQLT